MTCCGKLRDSSLQNRRILFLRFQASGCERGARVTGKNTSPVLANIGVLEVLLSALRVNAEHKTSKKPIFAILSRKDDKTQQMR